MDDVFRPVIIRPAMQAMVEYVHTLAPRTDAPGRWVIRRIIEKQANRQVAAPACLEKQPCLYHV
jgi:hypothetical protein